MQCIYLLCINPAIRELKSNFKLMKYGGKILGFGICGISKAAWNCSHNEEGMTGQIHRSQNQAPHQNTYLLV